MFRNGKEILNDVKSFREIEFKDCVGFVCGRISDNGFDADVFHGGIVFVEVDCASKVSLFFKVMTELFFGFFEFGKIVRIIFSRVHILHFLGLGVCVISLFEK